MYIKQLITTLYTRINAVLLHVDCLCPYCYIQYLNSVSKATRVAILLATKTQRN